MKKEIKALSKFDLYIEMTDFRTMYPTVIYGDVYHVGNGKWGEYWGVIATYLIDRN